MEKNFGIQSSKNKTITAQLQALFLQVQSFFGIYFWVVPSIYLPASTTYPHTLYIN